MRKERAGAQGRKAGNFGSQVDKGFWGSTDNRWDWRIGRAVQVAHHRVALMVGLSKFRDYCDTISKFNPRTVFRRVEWFIWHLF
jgi:hypothetical protein